MTMTKLNKLEKLPESLSRDCGMPYHTRKAEVRPVLQDFLEASVLGLKAICATAPERVRRAS